MKIGITGQGGFIGMHLYNFLAVQKDITLVPFKNTYFKEAIKLQQFVKSCDAIVHLAALNRHNNPQEIYKVNITLVKQLITACEITGSKPHLLFASSSQEKRDNIYGKSKLDGRLLFEKWAEKNKARFTGLIIPNVFGPFGNPYYNSFVATFCHQLTHNETPKIDVDGEVNLIYVGELVKEFYEKIKAKNISVNSHLQRSIVRYEVPHTIKTRVSEVLNILESYKKNYFEKGIIPNLDNTFKKNLFNTFLCYIDHKTFFPFQLTKHADKRGSFVELVKLNSGGQVSFSTTVQGITRGNHFHTRKAERFAVIKGKAKIELRRIGTDKIIRFKLNGDKPSFVDMPIWHTHNITNIGDEELYTIFWINEFYNPEDADTFFEKV